LHATRAERRPTGERRLRCPFTRPRKDADVMSAHELARLREEYDRQTIAWERLKKRFALLAPTEIHLSPMLLERLGAPAASVSAGIPARGFRA
jgi:hypothetical protein